MLPPDATLTPFQRAGYVATQVCISGGWLILLVAFLDWPGMQWSRGALGLQGLALLLALCLSARLPAYRLVVYPLVLAASIYLWDTTLPPPNLPSGWPRRIVPGIVLLALLADYAWARRARHHAHGHLAQQQRAPRQAASSTATVACPDRERATRRRAAERAATRRQRSRSAVKPGKPAWWVLYGWTGTMSGLLLGVVPRVVPPAWEMVGQIIWCGLTLAGMALWVRSNRSRLLQYDDEQVRAREQPTPVREAERTIPLTPVQRHFLDVIEGRERCRPADEARNAGGP